MRGMTRNSHWFRFAICAAVSFYKIFLKILISAKIKDVQFYQIVGLKKHINAANASLNKPDKPKTKEK